MSGPSMQTVRYTLAADHPALPGHFPGHPVLPGVSLLAHALDALAEVPALDAAVGPRPRVAVAKFVQAVRPGDAVTLSLAARGAGVDFRYTFDDGAVAASGRFEAGS